MKFGERFLWTSLITGVWFTVEALVHSKSANRGNEDWTVLRSIAKWEWLSWLLCVLITSRPTLIETMSLVSGYGPASSEEEEEDGGGMKRSRESNSGVAQPSPMKKLRSDPSPSPSQVIPWCKSYLLLTFQGFKWRIGSPRLLWWLRVLDPHFYSSAVTFLRCALQKHDIWLFFIFATLSYLHWNEVRAQKACSSSN